jgi:hypothetical protein
LFQCNPVEEILPESKKFRADAGESKDPFQILPTTKSDEKPIQTHKHIKKCKETGKKKDTLTPKITNFFNKIHSQE